MKGFIELTQVGVNGDRYRKIIAKSEIISVTEIEDKVFVQMERDYKGRIRIGIQVVESYEKVLSLLIPK